MTRILVSVWERIPLRLQQWLRGLEIAMVTGLVSAIFAAPTADFRTRSGWLKFLGEIGVVAGGCVRLYLTQSPIQNVLAATRKDEVVTDGALTLMRSETSVTTGPETK